MATRTKRWLIAVAIATLVLFTAITLIPLARPEAQRVEAETIEAGERLKVMNGGTAGTPFLMRVDFTWRNTFGPYAADSARHHYVEQYSRGMDRLLELGILEKRTFAIADTNSLVPLMRTVGAGVGGTPIWSVAPSVDGKTIVITAKKEDLPKWEALVRRYDTNVAVVEAH